MRTSYHGDNVCINIFLSREKKNSYQECKKQTISYKVYFYNRIYLSATDENMLPQWRTQGDWGGFRGWGGGG